MAMVNEAPTSQVLTFRVPPDKIPITEPVVIARCLAGTYGRKTRVKLSTAGVLARDQAITDYPQFLEAIKTSEDRTNADFARREREAEGIARKNAARYDPQASLPVVVREGEITVGEFLPDQVRYMFLTGRLTHKASFKHPDYEDWFSCASLFNNKRPADFFFRDEAPSEAVIMELRSLRGEMKAVKAECEKTTWATRGIWFFVAAVALFGFKIVFLQ